MMMMTMTMRRRRSKVKEYFSSPKHGYSLWG
jgi:hypothetical protein